MGRAQVITREISKYDSKLYCDKSTEGTLCIYRKSQRIESYILDDGSCFSYVRPAPFLIFALTDNWKVTGKPCDWGVEPILKRLRENDLHKRDLVSEIEKNEELIKKENDRDLDNYTEAFLKDNRREFAKASNDIRVANMDKSYDIRRKLDKRIKEN